MFSVALLHACVLSAAVIKDFSAATLETNVTLYLIRKLQLHPLCSQLLVFWNPVGHISYMLW